MLETFTPAVCRSRKRQIVAQALFSATAVLTAALLGLLLGLVGSGLGARRAVLAAAALALLAAAREAGLLRFALPQSRRQVPERWRFELPLPVWSSGYGAGLGAGFFTFQPVSTFWVACAAALALARPVPAALCLSLYGAGRALMVVWPRRREADPTEAVERLVRRQGALRRVNAVALVAGAVVLLLAPAGGAATRIAPGALDPSVSGKVLAYATKEGNVVVQPPGEEPILFEEARQPALHGKYLAYVDDQGIRVLTWRDGEDVPDARIAGANVSRPALHWPQIAFLRRDAKKQRIVVRNLETGASRAGASAGLAADVGRPSLRHGRLAWHVTTSKLSRVFVRVLTSDKRLLVAKTKIGAFSNPSLHHSQIVWAHARPQETHLRLGRVGTTKNRRTIAKLGNRNNRYWTTSLRNGAAFYTRWNVPTGGAAVWRQNY
ncbi:MAG TPA: hypothetical protein VK915_05045 [Gaiellaceae bacterium]|nr:hypothetical protein [Gaiellaceae bacterium]